MIDEALNALKAGQFVLLYDFDDRERETDIIIRSDAVTPRHIMQLRRDCGGLICTAVSPKAAERLGLPFASDIFEGTGFGEKTGDVPYDRKNHSSFSLWVNHRSTFTGITDKDRALTITGVAEQVRKSLNGGGHNFGAEFRTPGHCALLRAADGLLTVRRGQTELSIAMADMAGINPTVTMCEMLDNENGLALSKEGAKAYAIEHGLVFIEGKDVVERWEQQKR